MAKSRTLSMNMATFESDVRSHFDEDVASVRFTAGSEAANKRTVTMQVIDRVKVPWASRFLVEVWIQATLGGDPSATGNTVAWVSGNVTETVLPMGHWRIITDANGAASFDLTIAGAATRYFGSAVRGIVKVSDSFAWSA